ncbi:MAG TPA: TetR/AcrR family transcriptional regulator [Balneolaceae bacterium]|nr:TetR/AcrR family transcriptional regulator [Balneolaceae bacterium]
MAPKTEEQLEKIRQERSQSIIQAALKLFAEEGFANTTVSQIAREADISKGLIYNYFNGKEHLLRAVIQEGFKKMPLDFETPKTKKEAKLRLEQVLSDLQESAVNNRIFWKFYAELLLQLIRDEKLAARYEEEFNLYIQLFVTLLTKMNYPDPEENGRILAAQLDGILLHGLYFEDYPVEKVFKKIKKQYLQT